MEVIIGYLFFQVCHVFRITKVQIVYNLSNAIFLKAEWYSYCMKKNYNDCLIVNRKDMVQHSKACLYARDVLIAHIAAQIGLFRNNLKTDML